jgi:hypothetical protein
MKSRKHGGENMIRKAQWVVLALLFLALAFGTGCTSTTASAPPNQVITVTANGAYQQNAVVGTAYGAPLSVLVTTATPPSTTQTPVGAGVVVTFSAPQSAGAGGTFANGNPSISTTTNSSGIATATAFTANGTAGTYNVIAASPSTESTATFNLANTELPTMISTAGGTPQSTTEGTQFNSQLSVTVKDAANNPVGAQMVVTFKAPDGTFQDTFASTTTALTNASGVATAAPYTASSVVSGTTPYTVTATAENGLSATFTLSNTILPSTLSPVTGSTPQNTTVGTVFANLLSVTVVNTTTPVAEPVVGAYVTFTAPSYSYVTPPTTPPTPTVASGNFYDTSVVPAAYDLSSVSVWTDTSGTATAPPFEANTLASSTATPSYKVTATVAAGGGNSLTATFVLTNTQ